MKILNKIDLEIFLTNLEYYKKIEKLNCVIFFKWNIINKVIWCFIFIDNNYLFLKLINYY